MPCLDPDETLQLLRGTASPSFAASLGDHLAQCPPCRQLLSELARTSLLEPATAPAEAPAYGRGQSVGRYLVLHPVGQGGMGTVYAAYDPELGRQVALKLLDTQDEAAQATLLAEAQALARLAHPHVVSVHDVGREGRRVFLAMEYVSGATLAQWLATPRPLEELLPVFEQAGLGLMAAHAAGVVHRDFKPDNVMVGDDGRVRVTDFGLARTQGHGAAAGELAGTPRYMSPEQRARQSATEASDQYSFCVALEEALPRPIPPHLAQVIARGLAEAPEDRYPTMGALLAELRPPRARRGPWRALAVAAGLCAALGLGGRALWQRAHVCDNGEELASVWSEATRAELGKRFSALGAAGAMAAWERTAASLDAYARRWLAVEKESCEATQVRQVQPRAVMEAKRTCLELRREELRQLVDVLRAVDRSSALRAPTAAAGLVSLSRCERATSAMGQGAAVDPAQRALLQGLYGQLGRARALRYAGRLAEATEAVEKVALEARRAQHDPLLAEVLPMLGRLRFTRGDRAQGLESAFEGVLAAERAGDPLARAGALGVLAFLQVQQGEKAQGSSNAQVLLALAQQLGDPATLGRAELVQGLVLADEQKPEQALAAYARSSAAWSRSSEDRLLEATHPLMNSALVLAGLGRYEEAAARTLEGIALAEKTFGDAYLELPAMRLNVGLYREQQGRYAEAFAEYQRAGAGHERLWGTKDTREGTNVELHLASCLDLWGRPGEALARLTAVDAAAQRYFGPRSLLYAELLLVRGNALLHLGRTAEALESYAKNLELSREAAGEQSRKTAQAYVTYGGALLDAGRFEEGRQQLARGLALQETLLGKEHPDLGFTLLQVARGELARHQPGQALEALTRGRRLFEQNPALEWERATLDLNEAQARWALAQKAAAVSLGKSVLERYHALGNRHAQDVKVAERWVAEHRL